MKFKALLLLIVSFLSLTVVAQHAGGIEGTIVSRTTRMTIDNVKVTLLGSDITTVSDEKGKFYIHNLASGEYTLHFETAEYEDMDLPVRVEQSIREIRVVMIPANRVPMIDDAVFAEFDMEIMEDAQSLPSSLSASKDVFNNIASYQFSEMRFNVRGYDSQFSDVYMNGIQLNDAMTGYTPWSLWSGLNDATRNQEVTTGIEMGDMGIGGIAGVTNINTRPSQMRKGWRMSLVNSNSMYRFRGMLTYSSGVQDNGWSYAFSLSTRQGNNAYINGVYYNAYGYFATVEKQFNPQHRLGLTVLGAPTERGAQMAATQEAYDLVGNNYYNPNWGWQDGKRRNARVRDYHEPLAMLNYTFDITDRSQLNIATSLRFGKNGYSALTWYGGPDPRPDYYRYLPSFYDNTTTGAWLEEAWLANTNNIRHINWDDLYMINRNQPENLNYGMGHRSINMIEERHTDQLDWNFYTQFSHIFKDNSKISGGVNFRRNRTEYYSQVKDLLGGDYWVDIDKFAERDFGSTIIPYQNNMDYYERYGKAPIAREGDKYSYDYYGNNIQARAWAHYNFSVDNLEIGLGGELGHSTLWRHGIWRKGLFLNNSQGDSEKQNYLTYKAKANFRYTISAAHTLEANVVYMQDAPAFQYAFVSPRTRNSETPGVSAEKIFGVDASYNLRMGDLRVRLSGYYTTFNDQTKVISYYDDVESTYSNFAMSGIDKQHFGLEVAASIPLYEGLALKGALSWGQYTYTNNPNYIQIQDNSGQIKNQGKVYWKGKRVESTPQTAANIGLSYRSSNNIFASVDLNYYNNMYLSMSPLYRTDAVLTSGMSQQDILDMRSQEKFDAAYVLNASIGKNWYIKRIYTLGFSLSVDNLLNNQGIKTGGFEQVRLLKNKEESTLTYQPFDSKYFYMYGTNYYLNVYFRF
ncbi:MAG TPA: TonB-dependent receptor [Candidatus Phocaeicola gallistercoris]|nr:TonB-dependent receptor [Candidatus Phocaeicola gallistercoris]